jgi:hypothetical protein
MRKVAVRGVAAASSILLAAAPSSAGAQTPAVTSSIQAAVRAVAAGKQLAHGQFAAARWWLSANRAAIIDARPGPFDPTPQYVTTYSAHRVYVHILDWQGKNNLTLPAILDRPVARAWLLESGRSVRVDQAPWGTLIVVPEEQRPNAADTIVVLEVPGSIEALRAPRLTRAAPDQPVVLMGDTAKLSPGIQYERGPDWLTDWTSTKDQIRWRVQAPSAGPYEVYLTYSCARGCEGAKVEISANGSSRVVATTHRTQGVWNDWQAFERVPVGGKLNLTRGVNEIVLRALKKSATPEILRLYQLQLVSPAAERAAKVASQRALAMRADASWMRSAKYGLMMHWLPNTTPRSGPAKPYCEAVRDLDVNRLAQTAKDAGADYFIFSLAQRQFFPMPLRAADAVLSGRTCDGRDLVKDLSEAFTRRGMRFILYYHHGVGDPDWARAAGFLASDKSRFFANEAAVLSEIGARYGTKLSGWWFDDRYPLQPFEELDRAAKTGNPNRLVAFNSWIMPKSTDFQDYWAGEMGGELHPLPSSGFFDDHGSAAGLQPHVLVFIDDPWLHGSTDAEIARPLFSNDQLITFVRDTNSKGGPVTLNIGVYQDGSVSPATLKQLQALKAALKGR